MTAQSPIPLLLGLCLSVATACDAEPTDGNPQSYAHRAAGYCPVLEHPVIMDGLVLESTDTPVSYLALSPKQGAIAELHAHVGAEEAVLASCTANNPLAGGLLNSCSVDVELPDWAWQSTKGQIQTACPKSAAHFIDLSNYVFGNGLMPFETIEECLCECSEFETQFEQQQCIEDCTDPGPVSVCAKE